jgi:hypothetical protein
MTASLDKTELRNAGLNLLGESFWLFQVFLVAPATVLTVLLMRYGATPGAAGAISALEGGFTVLPQALGIYLFHSRKHKKRNILAYHFLVILPLMALFPLLSDPGWRLGDELRRGLLLGAFAMYVLSAGVVGAAWPDWIAHLFRREIRGRVIGASMGAAALAGVGASLLAGRLIQGATGLGVYSQLYALAFVIGLGSMLVFCFVRDEPGTDAPEPAPPDLPQVVVMFRQSLTDPNFRRYLIGRVLATSGFCIGPFLAVYYHSSGGGALGDGQIVYCGAAQQAAMALAMFTVGALGDRRGHRLGVLISAAAGVLALAVLLGSHGLASCLAAYACLGACVGAGAVANQNILYETCPHNNRAAHITVGNLALALPALAAPLLAGQVARLWTLPVLFAICLTLGVAALAWFALKTRDPRDPALAPAEGDLPAPVAAEAREQEVGGR